MIDPTFVVLKALRAKQPIVIVEYHSAEERTKWVTTITELFEPTLVRLISNVNECFLSYYIDAPLVLIPSIGTSTESIEALDSLSEHLHDRSQPIVVMLQHSDDCLVRLRQLPNLVSLVGGLWIDVHSLTDQAHMEDRQEFIEKTKLTPIEWLEKDRRGEFADTLDTNLLRMRALSIEAISVPIGIQPQV